MHILLTADPELPVPPITYGGIEQIVADLIVGLREGGDTPMVSLRTPIQQSPQMPSIRGPELPLKTSGTRFAIVGC